MLPLIGPTVAGVAILTFDNAIRDISSVILLTSGDSRPLSILLFEYSSTSQLEQAAALGVIMSVVTLLFGLVATKLVGGRLRSPPDAVLSPELAPDDRAGHPRDRFSLATAGRSRRRLHARHIHSKEDRMAIAISTDIGGTFTDLVAYDLDTGTIHQAKDYTDPADFSNGVARCIDKSGLALAEAPEFVHGSTVAINTAIERTGAPDRDSWSPAGMRDVYEIGRSNRPEAYNLWFHSPVPLVPRDLIFEVQERLAAGGAVLEPLEEASVVAAVEAAVAAGAESLAVCTLHSYANPAHEERIGEIVQRGRARACTSRCRTGSCASTASTSAPRPRP